MAEVDDADAALVGQYGRWCAVQGGRTMYARAYERQPDGSHKPIALHRLIMDAKPGQIVDHRDGDGLNNRRSNLRFCTTAENVQNQRAQKDRRSPFKGVHVRAHVRQLSFVAVLRREDERVQLGPFESEHRAARAYDAAARLFFGRFAKTNKDLGLYEKYPDRTAADIAERKRSSRVRRVFAR